MNANNITLIIVAAILLIAFWVYMSAPKYQYRGSNYYGGGNVEEQLAFIGGWSPQMRNLY